MMMMSQSSGGSCREDNRRRGRRRTRLLFVWLFLVVLLLGSGAVYLRLWEMDGSFSTEEREALRRQFDRANMEAMDETAEWRMRYDSQVLTTNRLQHQLSQVKTDFARASDELETLQKEKDELQNLVESLKQNCNCSLS